MSLPKRASAIYAVKRQFSVDCFRVFFFAQIIDSTGRL